MESEARKLLERVVNIREAGYELSDPECATLRAEIVALLSKPEPKVVWAEAVAAFYLGDDGKWKVATWMLDVPRTHRGDRFKIRVPVPSVLLNPVVEGEVVPE